jgi:hypothetical protein
MANSRIRFSPVFWCLVVLHLRGSVQWQRTLPEDRMRLPKFSGFVSRFTKAVARSNPTPAEQPVAPPQPGADGLTSEAKSTRSHVEWGKIEDRARRSRAALRRAIGFGFLAGLFCILIYEVLDANASSERAKFWLTPLEQLGFALWVAAATALMFDVGLQRRVVGDLLKQILATLNKTRVGVEEGSASLIRSSALLGHAAREGLVAIYRRTDPEYHVAVSQALAEAEEFVLIVARAGQQLFGTEERKQYHDPQLAWLLDPLLRRLANDDRHQPEKKRPAVFILLADGFAKTNQFRREVEWRGAIPYAMRETVRGLLRHLDERSLVDQVGIRVIGNPPPPYAAIVTDRRAFIEQHLPHLRGGSSIVLEVSGSPLTPTSEPRLRGPLSLYEAYREDAARLYVAAQPVADAIKGYIRREHMPDSPKRMVARSLSVLPIAERTRRDEPKTAERN